MGNVPFLDPVNQARHFVPLRLHAPYLQTGSVSKRALHQGGTWAIKSLEPVMVFEGEGFEH